MTPSEESMALSMALNDILPLSSPQGTDLSHSLRMTINVPPIMTPFLPIVILNGRKNAVREKRETAT